MKKTIFTRNIAFIALLATFWIGNTQSLLAQFGCGSPANVKVEAVSVYWNMADSDNIFLGEGDPRFTVDINDNPDYDGLGNITSFLLCDNYGDIIDDDEIGSRNYGAPLPIMFNQNYPGACTGDPATENAIPATIAIEYCAGDTDAVGNGCGAGSSGGEDVQCISPYIISLEGIVPCTPTNIVLPSTGGSEPDGITIRVTVTQDVPAAPNLLANETTIAQTAGGGLYIFPSVPGVTYTWYSDLNLTTVVGTGNTYNVPIGLSIGDHYYFVQASSPCGIGGASAVTVHIIDDPTAGTTCPAYSGDWN